MDNRDFLASFPSHIQPTLDQRAMTISFTSEDDEGLEETITLPAKFVVCETCRGKGTHVNPSIDAHGISREEFDEDPGFAEDYMSGVYDVQCVECNGNRVTATVDEDGLDQEQVKHLEKLNQLLEDDHTSRREMAHEQEMGY